MTAEPLPIAVDPAVRRPLGDIAAGAERFTQARVERIIGVVVALGFAVLGVQAFLNALGSTQESPPWHLALMIGVFAPLALAILACATGIGVRVCTGLLAVVLPLAVIAWPVATAGRGADAGVDAAVTVTEHPWVWYLLNVATVAAVMAFRMPLQIAWAVLVPVLYAAARLLQLDADAAATAAVILDAVFAMILAGVVIALAWMLRAVALGIDRARRDAVDSYAAAAAADAVETERIAVAALMHDSVLAALIAAERAETPREEALAAAMAREALTRLANADHDSGEGPDDPVAPAGVAAGIQAAARELGAALTVRAEVASDAGVLPGRVIRMLLLHDLVEIDVGDVPIHSAGGQAHGSDAVKAAEAAAARRIFGLLPASQAGALLALWQEFEAATSPDAVFAKALDRCQPVLQNLASGGLNWMEYRVTYAQVVERVGRHIARGAPGMWSFLDQRLQVYFARPRAGSGDGLSPRVS